jgi:hypothetical protein
MKVALLVLGACVGLCQGKALKSLGAAGELDLAALPELTLLPGALGAAGHYGNPEDGCEEDEVAVRIQGVAGAVCSPKCAGMACPQDVPEGCKAAPQCLLQDGASGNKYCALKCSAKTDCGPGASCKTIFPGIGYVRCCGTVAWVVDLVVRGVESGGGQKGRRRRRVVAGTLTRTHAGSAPTRKPLARSRTTGRPSGRLGLAAVPNAPASARERPRAPASARLHPPAQADRRAFAVGSRSRAFYATYKSATRFFSFPFPRPAYLPAGRPACALLQPGQLSARRASQHRQRVAT